MSLHPFFVCISARSIALTGLMLASAWPAPTLAQVAVSDRGSATISRTLSVPPGPGGLAPVLSVSYDSRDSTNSALGVGWSLGGVQTIHRCTASRSPDGFVRGVEFKLTDKLCLDGERLIPIDASGNAIVGAAVQDAAGSSGSGYTEYRTEKDSYARIRGYGYATFGLPSSGPAWFQVWTKSGQVLTFGNMPVPTPVPIAGGAFDISAQIRASYPGSAQLSQAAQIWPIVSISNKAGASIRYKYLKTPATWGSQGAFPNSLEWNVGEIVYGTNKVVFTYDSRPQSQPQDGGESYTQGVKSTNLQRLRSITTYINSPDSSTVMGLAGSAVAVKTYKFDYEAGPVTQRSRMVSMQECAGSLTSNKCLPAAKFGYTSGGSDAYSVQSNFNLTHPHYNDLQNRKSRFVIADFDGDGRDDILDAMDAGRAQSGGYETQQLWLSNGDGRFIKSANFDSAQYPVSGLYRARVVDINNDGLPDLFLPPNELEPASIYLNRSNGIFTFAPMTGTVLPLPASYDDGGGVGYYFVDVDGDGQLDIVVAKHPGAIGALAGDDLCQQDMITCTRIFKGNGQGQFTEIPTNLKNRSIYSGNTNIDGAPTTVDFDGDGLQDIIITNSLTVPLNAGAGTTTQHTKTRVARSRGDGNFDLIDGPQCPQETHRFCGAVALDYNGSGRYSLALGTELGPQTNKLYVADGVNAAMSEVRNSDLTATGRFLVNAYIDEQPGTGNTQGTFPPIVTQNGGSLVLDANNDGRDDILIWNTDVSQNQLLISNGDGTFTTSPSFNLKTDPLIHCFGFSPVLTPDRQCKIFIGNFTGRGHSEILQVSSFFNLFNYEDATATLLTKANPEQPDLLTKATSETGSVTTVSYFSSGQNPELTYGRRYKSDAGTAAAASGTLVDIAPRDTLVATVTTDTGVGTAQRKTEYRYTGLKFDVTGRGVVGYREVEQQTPGADGSPLLTRSSFVQTFPYLGRQSASRTYAATLADPVDPNGGYLSYTQNSYCDQTANSNAYNQVLQNPAQSCASTAVIKRPYLVRSVTKKNDLNGTPLPSTTTTALPFTAYGEPTQITSQTTLSGTAADTYQSVTTFDYVPDSTSCAAYNSCNWVVGRLANKTETRSAPNTMPTTTAGSAPDATSLSGLMGCTGPLTVTSNTAQAMSAIQGGAPATGTVTFTNAGTQATKLTMSGLSAPYSASPTSCTAAANGGACSVTVTMLTSGSIGSQGAQTLTASRCGNTAASAPVSGTLTSPQTTTVVLDFEGALPTGSTQAPITNFYSSGPRNYGITFSGGARVGKVASSPSGPTVLFNGASAAEPLVINVPGRLVGNFIFNLLSTSSVGRVTISCSSGANAQTLDLINGWQRVAIPVPMGCDGARIEFEISPYIVYVDGITLTWLPYPVVLDFEGPYRETGNGALTDFYNRGSENYGIVFGPQTKVMKMDEYEVNEGSSGSGPAAILTDFINPSTPMTIEMTVERGFVGSLKFIGASTVGMNSAAVYTSDGTLIASQSFHLTGFLFASYEIPLGPWRAHRVVFGYSGATFAVDGIQLNLVSLPSGASQSPLGLRPVQNKGAAK